MAHRRCAVYGCLHAIPKSLRFCTDHWKMIPASLQWKLTSFAVTPNAEDSVAGALEAIERETARRAAFHQ